MRSIKKVASFALMGCLMLVLAWGAEGEGSAQGDTLPGAVEGIFTPVPLTLWEGEDGTDAFDVDWYWYGTGVYYAGKDISAQDLCDMLTGVQFHNGDVLYYATFLDEQGDLYYRTVDVSTMQVSQVMFPQVFGIENILGIRSGEGRCHVLTDRAVYTFDAALALVRRAPLPTALHELMDRWADEQKKDRNKRLWSGWDVNPSGTAIVYRDISSSALIDWEDPEWEDMQGGFERMETVAKMDYENNNSIWACALQPDAVPRRMLPSCTRYGYYFDRENYGIPYFVGDDRIFVRNWGWEWSNYWEVWDMNGNRLHNSFVVEKWDAYPEGWKREARDAQGLFMHNPSSVKFPSTFYFDYETLQLERLPLLSHPPYDGEWEFCAVEGRTCIFAMSAGSASGQGKRIDFFRYAFDTQTVEPLPLTLHGVYLVQAALAPGGRIVFLYGKEEWRPQYAGVFQCP